MDKRAYAREWYAKNRESQLPKARERMWRFRDVNLRFRALYLSSRPCSDCGEPPDPLTPFEFDHRTGIGASSHRRVSNLVTKGTSLARLVHELQHCDVVCPTCHKQRTYDRGQWKRA